MCYSAWSLLYFTMENTISSTKCRYNARWLNQPGPASPVLLLSNWICLRPRCGRRFHKERCNTATVWFPGENGWGKNNRPHWKGHTAASLPGSLTFAFELRIQRQEDRWGLSLGGHKTLIRKWGSAWVIRYPQEFPFSILLQFILFSSHPVPFLLAAFIWLQLNQFPWHSWISAAGHLRSPPLHPRKFKA